MEKARYIIPTVEIETKKPSRYITTYQKLDIAVGFKNYNEFLEEKILINSNGEENYEFIFFNVDSASSLSTIPIENNDLVYLMTTFDVYSLEKAIEAFSGYRGENIVNKIILANNITPNHNAYLDYLFSNTKVQFTNNIISFPYDNGDLTIIFENQRAGRLEIAPFSKKFKTSLMELVQMIGEDKVQNLNKYMKELEKL